MDGRAACAPLRRKLLAEARATSCGRRAGVVQVIAKLDRLTRNARLLLSVVEGSGEARVLFCGLLTRPAGNLLITQMTAVAELKPG